MSVEVHCPHCNAVGRVNSRFSGRRVHCPKCNGWVDVPVVQTEPLETVSALRNGEPSVEVAASDTLDQDDTVPILPEDSTSSQEFSDVADLELSIPVAGGGTAFAASAQPSVLVTGASLHPSHLVTEGHSQGLEFDENAPDDEPPKRIKRDEGELDMTPMVDVTFLLLIFFMVTAAFALQKSLQMPRQQSDAPSASPIEVETEELDSVEVQIDERGSFLVMGPDWERETPGKQNLLAALKDAIGGGTEGMRLVIKVHEAAKLKALVDCMDAGTIAGYTELQVTQVEEFD
jgi:biopolymer transport protein ExbD